GSSILGFFWPVHSVPVGSGISAYSHYSEIVYIDIKAISPDPLLGSEILSHELQHLLQFSSHHDQDLWLDEGLSVFSERLCGFDSQISTYQQSYFYNPFRSLIYFDQSPAAYGFSSLFVQYLYERFGISSLKGIYSDDSIGLNAVIGSLLDNYPDLTASQLFINFSLALYLQFDTNPWFNIDVDYKPISSPKVSSYPYTFDWIISSWSFITFDISSIPSSFVVRVSFDSTTPYDSFGYSANLYLSLVEYNDTCIKLDSWLMDPYTCNGRFLMTFDPSFNNRLLFVHSLAGVLGGPLPASYIPSVNGSFVLSSYDSNKPFFFPGFIIVNASNFAYASSVRYYSDPYHEFTGTNTPVAKWRLFKYSASGSYEATGLTGDLVFSSSGWSLDHLLALDRGEYFFEFEFFDGSQTISHFSDDFTVGNPLSNTNPANTIPTVIFLFLILASVGVSLYLLRFKRRMLPPISPTRPENLHSHNHSRPKFDKAHDFSVRSPATRIRRRRKY
ncbi:MAG: hypothetical protein ACTSPG_05125, partial [Candidatus Hodarchaeales archaeon]